MSSTNYSNLLIGWGSQPIIQLNVTLGAVGMHYSAGAATTARTTLTVTYGWTINNDLTP